MLQCFKEARNKRKAIRHVGKWFHIHIGFSVSTVKIAFGEWRPDGIVIISQYGGKPLPDFIPKELAPSLHESLRGGMADYAKHVPEDYPPEVGEADRKMAKGLGLKHTLYISHGKFVAALLSFDEIIYWSPEMLTYLKNVVERADAIWKEAEYK
jgi:hypothetical protein